MPLYGTKCENCGATDSIFRKIAEMDNLPSCKCGGSVVRVLSAPAIRGITPYVSPGTGKYIDSPAARDADLKASKAFLYESGVEKDIERNKQYTREKAFKPIESAVDQTVSHLVNSGLIES